MRFGMQEGTDRVVGIATRYGQYDPAIELPVAREIFRNVQICPLSLLYNGYRVSFPEGTAIPLSHLRSCLEYNGTALSLFSARCGTRLYCKITFTEARKPSFTNFRVRIMNHEWKGAYFTSTFCTISHPSMVLALVPCRQKVVHTYIHTYIHTTDDR
jgi:hypothetical protein